LINKLLKNLGGARLLGHPVWLVEILLEKCENSFW